MNKEIESLFADMGKAWDHLVADSQLRWYASLTFRSHLASFVFAHAEIVLLLMIGSAQRRALFILQQAPWTMLFGICMPGLVGSLSGNFSST